MASSLFSDEELDVVDYLLHTHLHILLHTMVHSYTHRYTHYCTHCECWGESGFWLRQRDIHTTFNPVTQCERPRPIVHFLLTAKTSSFSSLSFSTPAPVMIIPTIQLSHCTRCLALPCSCVGIFHFLHQHRQCLSLGRVWAVGMWYE